MGIILFWQRCQLKGSVCSSFFSGSHLMPSSRQIVGLHSAGVRALIALHRGRVNISGGSKIAWMNVECNGDSLSVAAPSKVFAVLRNSCYSSVTNLLLGGDWRDSERIETAALPKNLFIWQQLHVWQRCEFTFVAIVVEQIWTVEFISVYLASFLYLLAQDLKE